MASKQIEGEKNIVNGSNTAIFITGIKPGKQSLEDLSQLAEICSRSNNPLSLFIDSKIKNSDSDKLINEGKIFSLIDAAFPDDIRNVCPVKLPLSNEPGTITKWIITAGKHQTDSNLIAANGKFPENAAFTDKYFGYWANFWPKLFIGVNSNLSACEAILVPVRDFETFFTKGIKSAWQLAALAEKNNCLSTMKFEYPKNSFVFGDGLKGAVSGKLGGFVSLFNNFIKMPSIGTNKSSWTDINANVYKKTFGIVAAALLALMCWISFDYNITWDEPNHNTFSKDVLKYYSSFGNDTTMFDFGKAGHRDYVSNVYYGMSIDVAASAINSIFSIKNEYATRHFLNAIVGFFAILFTALTVRLLSGWLPALITLLAMVCSPSFFGHCFNNPKDIPFAAGYIMALYYILRLLKESPHAKHQTKVLLAVAIGFALSIRAGGLLLFGYLFMAYFLYLVFSGNKNKSKGAMKSYVISFLVISVGGYALGILMWPYALRQPLTGAYTALREFEKFGFLTYYELFEGTRQYIKPWHYEPKLIALTAPLAIVGGFALSLLTGWFRKNRTEFFMFTVLIFATLFPAAYAIYKNSYVYNGWRHFIFIYPSLAALAILGWYWLVSIFKNQKIQTLTMLIIGITFIKPGIWSIANHPYQYLYFNEIAGGIKGANGNYELDYWNQTPREAFAWLIKNKPEVLDGKHKVSSNNIQESLKTFNPEGDSVKYAWTREYEWTDNDWKYAIWTTRTLSKNQILGGYWPPKGTIHEVKVDGVTVAAVVKSPNNFSYLGKQMLKKNKPDSALYYYSQCFTYNPLEEEYARGVADACKALGRLDSAILFYNKAIALRDGNYEAFQSLGEVYFSKAYAANPSNPDPAWIEKAYQNFSLAFKNKKNSSSPLYMAEIRRMQNKLDEAKDNYNLFLSNYPNAAEGYLGLAKTQMMLNESDSALYNLQVAIQLNPNMGEAYELIYNELIKTGRKQEAEQFLKQYMQKRGPAPTQ